jgi:spermidine synthase
MRRISFGVLLIALATLMLELMLTRVFDVVLSPNLGYFIVTVAVFAFGLAGIYATLKPISPDENIARYITVRSVGFAVAVALTIPLINWLPLDYTRIGSHTIRTVFAFLALYAALIVPFFLAGSVLIAIFSKYALSIRRLYFWDLVGAGLGSVIVMPFMAAFGPGGLILWAAALGLLAAALFTESRIACRVSIVAGVIVAALPMAKLPGYIDFTQHTDKRGVMVALEQGRGEFARWDPISRIDVIDETWTPAISAPWHTSGDRKAIQYDGGNQSSYFYKFNGDLPALRAHLDLDKSHLNDHFWQIGVLASHYLKRDSGQKVLILGSAGGQETKAALMYGAAHVDAVELVPTVVELGTGRYSSYIGDIFKNPKVHVQAGEGRSFLRHSDQSYDIIQLYSNHTNSSIEQGTGALTPVYLQTAEAYEEYFSHLAPNGVLHINHYAYPRMITTAALAWKRMGRSDFARHVLVFVSPTELTLPTMLIKMTPWTPTEVADLSAFLAPPSADSDHRLKMVEDPLDSSKSFLSADFYSGDFPDALADRMAVYVTPRTDDKPYFHMLRKSLQILKPDPANYLDPGTAYEVNAASIYTKGIPMDWIHLILTGAASGIFIIAFVVIPLFFSSVGKKEGATSIPLLVYFSCLGAAFITLELVFIQKFTHLIGSPLYTFSTVIFSMLCAAGIGSAASERMGIGPRQRWPFPFVAIIVLGAALVLLYPTLSHWALALPLVGRIAAVGFMIFPLGFFLGMPFPLGVLAIANHPRGAIAWAWGMNGLFTVAGGFISMLISMGFGFDRTIGLALGLYGIALCVFRGLLQSEHFEAKTAPITEDSAVASRELQLGQDALAGVIVSDTAKIAAVRMIADDAHRIETPAERKAVGR